MTKSRKRINSSKYLIKYGLNLMRYPFMSNAAIFADIYHKKIWNHYGSVCGDGSTEATTKILRKELPKLLEKYKISSILDIPCCDASWISKVEMQDIRYIGADIVPKLTELNSANFANRKNCEFRTLDICSDPLPDIEMIFCRDCLVHLSNKHIINALENIKKSGAKYLMMTTFPDHNKNFNMLTGGWRAINFEKPPFNLHPPIEIINEQCFLRGERFTDKSMALWELKDR